MVARSAARSGPAGTATRQRIVVAGDRTLAARGYHGTTVDLVAREAGVSVATFYRYLASIEELLHVLAREYQASVEPDAVALFGAVPGRAGDTDRLAAAQRYVATYRRYEGVARVWGSESARDATLRELSAASTRRIESALRGALTRAGAPVDRRAHAAHLVLIGLVERLPYQLALPLDAPGFPPDDGRLAELLAAFVGATVAQLARASTSGAVAGNSVT